MSDFSSSEIPNSSDCISRQAAIDEIEYELEMINSTLDSITLDFNAREILRQRRGEAREILNSIQQLPSAQPEPRPGRWEMLQIPINPPIYKCSECGSHALLVQTGCFVNRHYEAKLTNFCPNCGAKMLKEGE